MFKFSEQKQMLASCQTCNRVTEIHTQRPTVKHRFYTHILMDGNEYTIII